MTICVVTATAIAPPAHAQTTTEDAAASNTGEQVDARFAKHVYLNRRTRVSGTVSSGQAGRPVVVQLRRRGAWRTVARATTREGGAFSTTYRVRTIGRLGLRVRLADAPPTASVAAAETGRVTAYRRAYASWYGPGLYGNRLACGGRLSTSTIGVAHKTLPCGTRLTLRHRGRVVNARVIDRGPYVGGREFDLTSATKNRLGFSGHGYIWSSR